MSTAGIAAVVALIALGLSLASLALSLVVMRQSGRATSTLRRHRIAHNDAYGTPDPRLDRRQINLGPPRSGERRGAHRHTPPTADQPIARPDSRVFDDRTDDPPTDPAGATVWNRGTNPYRRLEATADPHPATTDLRAIRPDVPR